jgi:hypothetical protein
MEFINLAYSAKLLEEEIPVKATEGRRQGRCANPASHTPILDCSEATP